MKKILLILGVAALMAACGSPAPLEKGTVVESVSSIEANEANSGLRFAVEGYLSAPQTISAEDGNEIMMGVHTMPAGEGKYLGSAPVKYGNGKNSFEVEGNNFEDEDIVFTDNDGVKHNYDVKAMFSFTATRVERTRYNPDTKEYEPLGTYYWEYSNPRIDVIE